MFRYFGYLSAYYKDLFARSCILFLLQFSVSSLIKLGNSHSIVPSLSDTHKLSLHKQVFA